MALVGHISGSSQSNSVIGISGSVIVANRPNSTFPAMPGTDVKLYVEGLSLFGSSGLTSSGSLSVKDTSGAKSFEVVSSTGNTTIAGDLAVNGGDLTTTQTTFNLINSTATSVNLGGAAQTLNVGGAGTRVVVAGDLEVQGTTVTVDATTVTVEDPLIGLGFTSGSVSASPGDRGWVGGMSGDMAGNVAMIWDNDYTEFAVEIGRAHV